MNAWSLVVWIKSGSAIMRSFKFKHSKNYDDLKLESFISVWTVTRSTVRFQSQKSEQFLSDISPRVVDSMVVTRRGFDVISGNNWVRFVNSEPKIRIIKWIIKRLDKQKFVILAFSDLCLLAPGNRQSSWEWQISSTVEDDGGSSGIQIR